jgi:hypothetical protein
MSSLAALHTATKLVEQKHCDHLQCQLKLTFRIMSGADVYIPSSAFKVCPTRFARVLQIGNSALNLLFLLGGRRTLAWGNQLAYGTGEIQYTSDRAILRAISLFLGRQPFFIIPGRDPVASVAQFLGCDNLPAPQFRLRTQCLVIVKAAHKKAPAIFRVASCKEGHAELDRQVRGLKLAERTVSNTFIPRLISQHACGRDNAFSVETCLDGDVMPFSWKRIDAIRELWTSVNSPTPGKARHALFDDVAEVCSSLPRHRDLLCRATDPLLEWHYRSKLPAEMSHGDLWFGNVLFIGSSVTGIVDWEWARMDGVKVVDLLHLLLMSYAFFRNVGISIGHTLRQFWLDEIADQALLQRLKDLRTTFGIDDHDLKSAGLLLWFDYLHQRVIRGRMPGPHWTEDMILRTVPVIMDLFVR